MPEGPEREALIELAESVGNILTEFVVLSPVTVLIDVILRVPGFEIIPKLATPYLLVFLVKVLLLHLNLIYFLAKTFPFFV